MARENEETPVSDQILSIALRPQSLEGLVGQEKLSKAIKGYGKKPLAWMFVGPPGTGKTTISRIIALSYQGPEAEFGSPSKKLWKRRSDFDISEINASHFRGVEDIERIVRMSEYMSRPPTLQRVVILDEAQRMSAPAQNMLLQPFESGSGATVWMICTTDPQKIIPALRSRCVTFKLAPLRAQGVRELVEKVGKKIDLKARDAEKLSEELMAADVRSPRSIVQAIEKFRSNGGNAKEAAWVQVSDAEPVETMKICRAIASGKWSTAAPLLKALAPEDADGVLRAMMGYLRSVLFSGGAAAPAAAQTIERLARITFLSDYEKSAALAAILFEGARKFRSVK